MCKKTAPGRKGEMEDLLHEMLLYTASGNAGLWMAAINVYTKITTS